ncbi:MAG: ECF-type sigma factor [Acidobacteriota bacterium]
MSTRSFPPGEHPDDVTELLAAWQAGREGAAEALFQRMYPWLRQIAARQLRHEGPAQTLDVTELLHEAYLKLEGVTRMDWKSRQHFLAIGARVMRRILVDRARMRQRDKRGAGATHLSLEGHLDVGEAETPSLDLIALDHALGKLHEIDPLASRLVEVRYFGGMTVEESAAYLGIGRSTAVRTWQYARAWLRDALQSSPAAIDGSTELAS